MATDAKNSVLDPDISDILAKHENEYRGYFLFETKLHTEEKDLDYTDGVLLNDIYIVRNYLENIADYVEIKLSIPLGTFLYDVYPYLDNIEVTIITTKQLNKNKQPVEIKERYKAVYLLDKNSKYPNTIPYSKNDLNNQLPAVITLQLLDRSVETLRIKTTQGNFDKSINKNKDMKPTTFLKTIISEEANKILIENKPCLDSIDIEPADNTDELKSITIPSYTRIVELPTLIQEKNIGIYNGGIGIYIQRFGTDYHTVKKSLFIYSLYNNKKYDKSEYKTIFYSPNTSAFSITDITYKYKDKILKVIPYNVTNIQDNKEAAVMSTGSGFRVSNANSFMKKPVKITEKGPVFKRDSLSSEIVFKERKDGLNFAQNVGVSSNQFQLTSELLSKNGNYATLEISNIDPDFILPGGKCKILYENNEKKVTELFGVIHSAIIVFSNQKLSLAVNHNTKKIPLSSHATIQIFINSF